MKKIHWFLSIVAAALFPLSMTSCLDSEGYSLGDFWVDIATVHVEEDGAYSLILDNGKYLWPAVSHVFYKPKDGQRVFVNYTILSGKKEGYDHFVKINDISKILTKQVINLNAQNADSIGNNPVIVKDIWAGGDYLNVYFLFNYGQERPHAINLVINELSQDDTPDDIDLEFRHNAYNSQVSRLYEGFACFDLKPFQVSDADSVKFAIKVKEWEGEKIYDVVYRYNRIESESVIQQRISITPIISVDEYY